MRLSFTSSPLDHSGLERVDDDWIRDQQDHPEARVILFSADNPLVGEDGSPQIVAMSSIADYHLAGPGPIYLGRTDQGPWFAGWVENDPEAQAPDFRRTAMQAEHDLAAIMGRARSLVAWHQRRTFCSACGSRNALKDGGLRLQCSSCGMQHFPRVDPSVIMLPVHGDKCVMGRQASWPEGLYATLAGFIEPGETIEEACARETREETGLRVTSTRYLASQPWPFPSSLMIGLIAEVEDGQVYPDDDLEDARWFTRDEVRDLYNGELGRKYPSHFSISRLLIDTWLKG